MRLLRWLQNGWERFFAPQPQQGMVIARVGLGLVGLGCGLVKAGDVQRIFGPEGIGSWRFAGRPPANPEIQSALAELLGDALQMAPPELVWVLFVAMLLAALGFTLGAWTRVSGVALLVLHAIFFERNEFAYAGSWAGMYKAFLLYTVLAPTGRHLSVDAWRKRRRDPAAATPGWEGPAIPVRLLQMHVCTLYAAAGWARLGDAGWLKGEMVFAAMTDDWFGRFDVDWFPFLTALRLMSYAAFVLEPLAPFLLWTPLGRWWVLLMMGMHVSLELLTNLGWWQYQMLAVLPVFLPPQWLSRPLERVSRLLAAPRGP